MNMEEKCTCIIPNQEQSFIVTIEKF